MSTVVDLKKAAVAVGAALDLPGAHLKPPFGVRLTPVAGSHYRALLRAIAGGPAEPLRGLDETLKRAAVAEGKALGLSGRNLGPPFGVIVAPGRGWKLHELLWAISLAKVHLQVGSLAPHAIALYSHDKGQPAVYTMGPGRMQGILERIFYPHLPWEGDCSSTVTWYRFAANHMAPGKWPDPNGEGYDGEGYTGTMLEHGRAIAESEHEADDLAFYGHPVEHVAIIVARNEVVSHGSAGRPRLLGLNYRSDLAEIRRY